MEHQYYVPLESPKKNHAKIKSGGPVLKIDNGRLGIMGFNNMIPAQKQHLLLFDIAMIEDEAYRNLLYNQLKYCQKNKNIIYTRAKKTYEKATSGKNDFYEKVCCDFRRLESAQNQYILKKYR